MGLSRCPTIRTVFIASIVLRVALILYSDWHDAHSVVKYTDVDYRVFSDAARFLVHANDNVAKGPFGQLLGFGDPYARETYRYTPLLALLLAPNEWVHPSFGKYLFAGCDILNGALIYNMLCSVILPKCLSRSTRSQSTEKEKADNPLGVGDTIDRLATLYTAMHLFNPLVFTISTRGSSESVLASFILLTLWYALKGRWDAAAVLLGFSTHWKIYPVIFGAGCLGVVGNDNAEAGEGKEMRSGWKGYLSTIVNRRTLRFAGLSAGTFFVLGVLCYLVCGYPFIYETYLYHLHRLDHRHNFSPYFYLMYLTYPSLDSPPPTHSFWRTLLRSPLTSFVPQMTLSIGTGLLFGWRKEHLVFTWFVQSVVFVLFNKVCTSQYFLWYLLFVPLLLPSLQISLRRSIVCLAVWIGTQAWWLSEAYKLEFLGEQVFFGLWLRSCVYVLGNAWVLKEIMAGYVA